MLKKRNSRFYVINMFKRGCFSILHIAHIKQTNESYIVWQGYLKESLRISNAHIRLVENEPLRVRFSIGDG